MTVTGITGLGDIGTTMLGGASGVKKGDWETRGPTRCSRYLDSPRKRPLVRVCCCEPYKTHATEGGQRRIHRTRMA